MIENKFKINKSKNLLETRKVKCQKKINFHWPIKIFVLTVALSLLFSISSEFIMSKTGIFVTALIIVFLISVATLADMLGVAVTACDCEIIKNNKKRGVRESLFLLKNADKISSLCNDVIGDVCGILSGAAGASIIVRMLPVQVSSMMQIVLMSVASSFIAGFTIFGKALGKKYAMEKCENIVLFAGKIISYFCLQK
ncbi:MAG: hypothetical protein RR140_00760 [Clostridia bacterium]